MRTLFFAVPDRVFAPRGSFLGARDEAADELALLRSLIGFGYLALLFVEFRWKDFPGQSAGNRIATFLGDYWIQPIGLNLDWVLGVAVAVAFILAALTRRDRRCATSRALLTPLITMFWFAAFLAAGFLITFKVVLPLGDFALRENSPSQPSWSQAVSGRTDDQPPAHLGLVLAAVALMIVVAAFSVSWLLRAVWQVVTGLFRAEDGHPLLGIIAVPLGTIALACRDGVDRTYPTWTALAVFLAAPLSLSALSIRSAVVLRRQYGAAFPFLDGPLPTRPEPNTADQGEQGSDFSPTDGNGTGRAKG